MNDADRRYALVISATVGGASGILSCLLGFGYWLANPSDMFRGGRPMLMVAFALIGSLSAAWSLHGRKMFRALERRDDPSADPRPL